MNEKEEGFIVANRSLACIIDIKFNGKDQTKCPDCFIVKCPVIPCVWRYYQKVILNNSDDDYFYQWVHEIDRKDWRWVTESHGVVDRYKERERLALADWESFQRAYLVEFPGADLAELEKPETETKKKKRKQRVVLDANKKEEIVAMAKVNPGLTQLDLERQFGLGRGTISKNRVLAGLIKEVRQGTGRSTCKRDGTAYADD